jgi:hypothetical protein
VLVEHGGDLHSKPKNAQSEGSEALIGGQLG